MNQHLKSKETFSQALDNIRQRIGSRKKDEAERKRKQDLLDTEEKKFQEIAEIFPEPVFEMDQNGNFIFANHKALESFGYTNEEVKQGLTVKQIVAPKDWRRLLRNIHLILGGTDLGLNEYTAVRKNGEKLQVIIHSKPIVENNKVKGLRGILVDITELKRIETILLSVNENLEKQVNERTQELKNTNTKLQAEIVEHKKSQADLRIACDTTRKIIENAPFGIYIVNEEGNIDYVNPTMADISGSRPDEFKDINVFTHAPYIELGIADKIRGALSGKEFFLGPVEYTSRSSRKTTIRNFYGMPLEEHGKKKTLVFVEDITDLRKTQQKLEKSYMTIKRVFDETVLALASAVEKRDPYTAGHQFRTAKLACAIAKELGMEENQIYGLQMAATIHDIGKMYIPAEILSKPAKLSEIEFSIVKVHARVGYEILENIEFPWPVASIVLQHHERINGSGYPAGLKNGEILREAQILSVADVVEAMASFRPYRPALGVNKALEEISGNKGILYEPTVVDACINIFSCNKFHFD